MSARKVSLSKQKDEKESEQCQHQRTQSGDYSLSFLDLGTKMEKLTTQNFHGQGHCLFRPMQIQFEGSFKYPFTRNLATGS